MICRILCWPLAVSQCALEGVQKVSHGSPSASQPKCGMSERASTEHSPERRVTLGAIFV